MYYRSATGYQCEFADNSLIISALGEVNISTIATTLQQYITIESNKELDTFEVNTIESMIESGTNHVAGAKRVSNQRN